MTIRNNGTWALLATSLLAGCGDDSETAQDTEQGDTAAGDTTIIPTTDAEGDPADDGGSATGEPDPGLDSETGEDPPVREPNVAPVGVFVLGEAEEGPDGWLDNYKAAIEAEQTSNRDLFSGYVLRASLSDLLTNPESTDGVPQYDFSALAQALETIQGETGGVRPPDASDRVSLQIVIDDTLPIVIAQIPQGQRYTPDPSNAPDVEAPLPWSAAAVRLLDDLTARLSSTPVRDVDRSGAPQVPLRSHPTLRAVLVRPLGINGFRDNDPPAVSITTVPEYDRDAFVDGFLSSVDAYANAFPNKFLYMEYVGLADGLAKVEPLNTVVPLALHEAYNGPGQPRLGVFRSDLSEHGPTAAGTPLLTLFEDEGAVMFQMLTSWIHPFDSPQELDREPKTASGSPTFGIMLGYVDFGCRYFETYVDDLTLSDEDIHNRYAYLPPYGDAMGLGVVPVEDVSLLRDQLLLNLEQWNTYLATGPTAMDDEDVPITRGAVNAAIPVLTNDGSSPTAPTSREVVAPGVAQARAVPALSIESIGAASRGIVAVSGNQALYTPDDFIGSDSFSYTATDGVQGSNTARVRVSVSNP